ncbi:PatB family C-S lyase [Dinoroseobacter sp. PD6]|uniref:MalY/PatB family protein n=1 Tax=Dinoroseobacter sp. PD6 TaxID=3028384 RepID=UPI00237AD8CD|nr:PatB family C-S lyase [Dinoroseobacter sp. PD6]MDD9717310.1 PatB family C-S lyase [Dinoroseobacter sp. PD6]
MTFDTEIDRRNTDCIKWDKMESAFGVSPEDGLAMWIADMDFPPGPFLQEAMQGLLTRADYGYFCGLESYEDAIIGWMRDRHGWTVEREWMFTTYGLGNGIAITLNALTAPGDEVIIFSPVYHEFAAKITKTGRVVKELPLAIVDGVYTMDFDAYAGMLSGRETMVIACSPHNPAGRVWTQEELTALADFCQRHDLLLISDEIHADLTFAGHTHIPMHVAAPQIADRLVMTTSASKTFNIAGGRTGCVTIPDPDLRARFHRFFNTLDMQPNLLGVALTRAAYSPAGAAWCDALCTYLEGNAAVFNDGVNAIPGLSAMPMQGTYLAWVDFAGTGMERPEFSERVYGTARIAATPGHTLGKGGESCLRFNVGMPRARVREAVDRLADAFADLQ